MFRKTMIILFIISFGNFLLADVLVTKEGREIEGKVTLKDGMYWLRTVDGGIAFEMESVEKVIKKHTIFDEYEKKLAETDPKDLQANEELLNWCVANNLKEETSEVARRVFLIKTKDFKPNMEMRIKVEELADWCRRYGLDGQARELYREIYTRELSGLHKDDWRGRMALAKWCEQRDLSSESIELFTMVLRIQPDNSYANLALGNVKVGDKWIHRDELEKEKAEALKEEDQEDVVVIVEEPAPVIEREIVIYKTYPRVYRRVYPRHRHDSSFSFGYSDGKWDLRWGYNDHNRHGKVYRRGGYNPRPHYHSPRDSNTRGRDRDCDRVTRDRTRNTRSGDTRGPLRKSRRR